MKIEDRGILNFKDSYFALNKHYRISYDLSHLRIFTSSIAGCKIPSLFPRPYSATKIKASNLKGFLDLMDFYNINTAALDLQLVEDV